MDLLDLNVELNNLVSLGGNNTTLWSEAAVIGDYGSMEASGDSFITDLDLSIAGIGSIDIGSFLIDADDDGSADVDVNGFARAAANTYVLEGALSLLGVELVLNEQVKDCLSDGFCSMMVNAFRLSFDDFLTDGAWISGDIILGHSYAEMTASPSAVPVPAAVWLFGSGLMGLVGLSRRRQDQL